VPAYTRCLKCLLGQYREENGYKIVWGEGNPSAPIFILGEAPGENEAKLGRPFIGRSGQFLRHRLEPYIEFPEGCFISNTVLCRPPDNRKPAIEEQEACASHIHTMLFTIRPKLIITAGKVASDYLSILLGRSYTIYLAEAAELEDLVFVWLPIYHPSYVMRAKEMTTTFENTLRSYAKLFKSIGDF
jgi:uracil-DNA glycosylase